MKTDLSFDSTFANWRLQQTNQAHPEEDPELRVLALKALLNSFERGEITSLDGVTSVVSGRISEVHGDRPFEMNSHWILSAQDWICPCCRRDKLAISRIGSKGQILAKLVIHHDHMSEAVLEEFCHSFVAEGTQEPQSEGRRLVERIGHAFSAYESVLICEDCNNADTCAKRELALPKHFSFSIGQILRFIKPKRHAPHGLDLSIGRETWEDARPAYELRMRLIRAVARAAATDAHWYEPYARHAIPIPLFGFADAQLGFSGLSRWVSLDELVKKLGPQDKIHNPDRSRWRTAVEKPGKPPPENYLALLRSADHMSEIWDSVSDDWRCPVCFRPKFEQVYMGKQGKIHFYVPGTSRNPKWQQQRICNHCHSVIMSLKEEVTERAGRRPRDSFGYISPAELRAIIRPRAHSPHVIRKKEAAELVALAVARVKDFASEAAF